MPITIPDTSDGLRELMNDAKKVAEIFGESGVRNGLAKEFQDKFAAATMKRNPDTTDDMREQVQAVLYDMVRDNSGRTDNLGKMVSFNGGKPQLNLSANGSAAIARGKGTVYNKAAPGARFEQASKPEDRFSSIGEYCAAIRYKHTALQGRDREELIRKLDMVASFQNSFSSEDPGSGGFLIPEIMRSELLQLALENAIVRPRATVIPMSTLRVPIPTVDDTSHVSNLFGGITFSWTEEAASITESQATFSRIYLDAKKLAGSFKVPNELLADAPAFSGFFDTQVPRALTYFEDLAFLGETGAGTPQGVIGAQNPAYVQVDRTTNSTVKYADLVGMFQQMLPQSHSSAVWVASHDVFAQLAQMTLATPGIWMGGYGTQGVADAPPITIFGRPVIFSEKVPAMGTVGDISLIDFSYYLIGDRQAIEVAASEHFAFLNDQTSYRILERVDGRPWLRSSLTPHNNSTAVLSPYVGLSTTHT